MNTQKLFYENLYTTEFDAEIIGVTEDGIILNQTLFYPGGGGQPCDLGYINEFEIIDVHEDKAGNIVHVLKDLPENLRNIKNVHGVINWPLRFEMMQQHLGQHLFSAALHNLHGLHTARMRIENKNVSLDLDLHVDQNIILEAEAEANKIIWQNIPVEIIYPDLDEIKLHARKMPSAKAVPPFRIVKVGGFDYVPCCGLHVKNTGEVGLIKVISFENHKGGTRIYLKCGAYAYDWLKNFWCEVKTAENELVCGDNNINEKILNLKNQIHELKTQNENTIKHYLKPLAEKLLLNRESKIIKHVIKNSSQDEATHLFKMLTENPEIIALIMAESSDGTFLIFGCNKINKNVDVRNAFKFAVSKLNGKGGGSSFCSQGHGEKFNLSDLENILNEAENLIK